MIDTLKLLSDHFGQVLLFLTLLFVLIEDLITVARRR